LSVCVCETTVALSVWLFDYAKHCEQR